MKKNKKKKSVCVAGILLALAVGMLGGCGADPAESTDLSDSIDSTSTNDVNTDAGGDSAAEHIALKDVDVEQYVTLGNYKGLEVSVAPIEVNQEECDATVEDLYSEGLLYATGVVIEDGITDRAVENGDVVNIDYEGKKDGEAFGGGTAQAAYLKIGSGTFIDGFEEGLVGVMPGETVDLNLTFPGNYGNTDLAGQAVVFTVTVNYIMPEGIQDAIVEVVGQVFGFENVSTEEELRQYVYDYLYSYAEQNYNNSLRNNVMEALLECCEFGELPEFMLEDYEGIFRVNIETGMKDTGLDEETYLQYYWGYSDGLDAFLAEYVPLAVKQDLAVQAVANQENLNIDDETLQTILLEYVQSMGYSTMEDYLGEEYVNDADIMEAYRESFLNTKVLDFLAENAVVVN